MIGNRKLLVTIALLGGFLLLVGLKAHNRQKAHKPATEPVRKGPIVESVYGIGTVTANKSFQLKSGVLSMIRKLYVKEGDHVRAGDKLVMLDTIDHTAPFEGTVTAINGKEGENVFAQAIVLTLVDLADRYLVVSMEQRGVLRVRTGQRVKISFDSMRRESFDGVVSSVYSHDNDFLARIDAAGLPPQILPGMTGDVAIAIAEHPDALLLPVAALENGNVRVQRLLGGTKVVPVKTGVVDGAMAQIVSGDIQEGDKLVLPQKAK